MMTPDKSPQGLGKNIKVKRLNQRAKAIAFGVLLLGGLLLLGAIFNKQQIEGPAEEKRESIDLNSKGAVPPQSMIASQKKAKPEPENTANPPAKDQDATPDLVKEGLDFQREIRRDRQRSYMSKLSHFDSALASSVAIDSPSLNNQQAQGNPLQSSSGAQSSGESQPFSELIAATSGSNMVQNSGLSMNSDPNLQSRKEQFAGQQKTSGYLPARKKSQLSPYEVKVGTVIPAVMISGINSDLPGQIIAQVSETVYDTATGFYPLIPQGSRLVGSYDSFVAVGQERALVLWNRLIFPDGASLELFGMPGNDLAGYAGFSDQVNSHFMRTFGGAILLSLVGAGYQISQPRHDNGTLTNSQIIADQVGQQLSQISGEKIRQSMQIQPTIEIRPGFEFAVMVNRDMILDPWGAIP